MSMSKDSEEYRRDCKKYAALRTKQEELGTLLEALQLRFEERNSPRMKRWLRVECWRCQRELKAVTWEFLLFLEEFEWNYRENG